MCQHCIGVIIAEQGAKLVLAKMLEQSKDDDIVPTVLVLYGNVSWRDQAGKTMGIQIDRFQSTGSNSLELAPIKGFVWLLEEWGQESYHSAKQVLQTYLHFGELDDHAVNQMLGMHKTIHYKGGSGGMAIPYSFCKGSRKYHQHGIIYSDFGGNCWALMQEIEPGCSNCCNSPIRTNFLQ
ncbi:unnamed protein product [Calypogeia fissa]